MVTSSTTATSSTACAANRWRLLNLVYRDALFPRPAYRLAWERLLADGDPRAPASRWWRFWRWRMTAAARPNSPPRSPNRWRAPGRDQWRLRIDVAALQARFAPAPAPMPDIVVTLPPVASYDLLLPSLGEAA